MTAQKRWTLVAAVLGSGIVFLDSTVVNVALPKIGEQLQSGLLSKFAAENFVYYGYLLSLSALLILAGALNDFYGRRRMFVVGLMGFGLTSLLCGLAPNILLLIVFRVLQGAAGALLVPGSLAIITATFEGEEQGRAFGLWAGASAATTILGPFVGGLLVDGVSWRAVFFINVPLIAFAVWACLKHVQESRDEAATGQFDWLGATVVFLAVGGLSFGAIIGQQENWKGAAPFAALAIGGLAAIAFPILMARSRHPLVPLRLFRSRNFTVTNISTLVIYGALYVTFAFVIIFLQGTIGYNPTAAGLIGIPGTLFLALFSTRFGRLAARYGPRVFMTVGPAIMALGLLWFARIPASTDSWIFELRHPSTWGPPASYYTDLLPGFVLFGIGLMIMVAPLTTALMTSVPKENSGVASAVNNAISRVGPQLAGALIFVAIATSFYNHVGAKVGVPGSDANLRKQVAPLNPAEPGASPELKRASEEASTNAFHLAMLIAAGLLVAGAAVNAVGIRNPGGPRWMRQPKYAESPTGQRLVGHAGHLGPPPETAGEHT
ncbi:MAG TPA: MFS transporter [Actinomycetota bacterium]|nr:MFS transporter [Actinomycetota bacterium]